MPILMRSRNRPDGILYLKPDSDVVLQDDEQGFQIGNTLDFAEHFSQVQDYFNYAYHEKYNDAILPNEFFAGKALSDLEWVFELTHPEYHKVEETTLVNLNGRGLWWVETQKLAARYIIQ